MMGALNLTIPVALELGSSLHGLADAEEVHELKRRLASELNALLTQLGLRGEPAIEMRGVDSSRAVRVRVHGALQPYAPELMKRVWLTVAPADVRSLPDTTGATDHFPDAWFETFVADLNSSHDALKRELAYDYLSRLAFEVIRARPSCLVGAAQTAAYLKEGGEQSPHLASSVSLEMLSPVLKLLLNLGLSVANRSLVLQTVSTSRSAEDAGEAAFVRLRSNRIEIHVHPGYLKALIHTEPMREPTSVYAETMDASLRESFRLMEDGLFYEYGIHLPDLFWMPSTDVREGMIAVKINDSMGLPTLGLSPGELLVNDTVERLRLLNVIGRPATNPASGYECALVAERHKELLEQAGLTTWTLPQFVVLALSSEIRRNMDRLFTVEDAECQLAQLEQAFPELVQAVIERFSLEDIARVLRGLLKEEVSIRDSRTILEKLLQHDCIFTHPNEYIIFDDRLPLDAGMSPERAHHWTNYLEFVRSGLRSYISHKYSRGTGTLVVYLLDPTLETRLQAMTTNGQTTSADAAFSEAEREALRDAVWAKVGTVVTSTTPVILTVTGVRAALREFIAPECPNLPVVAYTELQTDLNVQPIARISLA